MRSWKHASLHCHCLYVINGSADLYSEFGKTVQVDPEAAKIVFESGLDVIMVPLEVTHTALVTNEVSRSRSIISS